MVSCLSFPALKVYVLSDTAVNGVPYWAISEPHAVFFPFHIGLLSQDCSNIQTAIGNHQQIRFQYYEYTQEKKKILKHDGYYYVVNPYALEWKNDHYYLIGFSLKHQKIAHFRVDRLTSVENLETYFMPIEGFDVASYTNKMVDMFTSESSKEVTLLCENELMRVIIDHYGEDAAVDRYDDTHFTAKIEVNPSGTFYGWIFKFKGKIKILSPKECITEMQQIAQEFI